MTRNHRRPGVVRIICTDAFHEDSEDWARYGHRWLLNLREVEANGRTRLIVPGEKQRMRTVEITAPDGTVLFEDRVDPQSPVKRYRLVGDARFRIFTLHCSCKRNPQKTEEDLLEMAAAYRTEKPGRRVELDLVELERRKRVRLRRPAGPTRAPVPAAVGDGCPALG